MREQSIDAILSLVESLKVGNELDKVVQMGPLIVERRILVLEHLVRDAVDEGATVRTGCKRVGNCGGFWVPTMLPYFPSMTKIMTGFMEAMHAAGRIEDIRAYCVTDVLSTSLVWLARLRLQGALGPAQLAAAHDALLDWLDDRAAGAPHLARFAARWRELAGP